MGKNLKKKIKTKSFWVAIFAAIIMILKSFGLDIGQEADRFVEAICGLLVSIGVICSPIEQKPDESLQNANQIDNKNE